MVVAVCTLFKLIGPLNCALTSALDTLELQSGARGSDKGGGLSWLKDFLTSGWPISVRADARPNSSRSSSTAESPSS